MEDLKILIVGGGRGGSAILDLIVVNGLTGFLKAIVDINEEAPAVKKARMLGIPTYREIELALKAHPDINLAIDVTRSKKVGETLKSRVSDSFHLIDGMGALFLFTVFKELNSRIERTKTLVDNLLELIKSESENFTSTEEVIRLIKGLSNQIKLLGINALTEAARAGEAGKGFSIVAEEVRKLAETSLKYTVEITGILGKIKDSYNRINNMILELEKIFKEKS